MAYYEEKAVATDAPPHQRGLRDVLESAVSRCMQAHSALNALEDCIEGQGPRSVSMQIDPQKESARPGLLVTASRIDSELDGLLCRLIEVLGRL